MNLQTNNFACPSDEIAAYIDGELDPPRELELDLHFSQCETCSGELNLQKQFLNELDAKLRDRSDINLPADFTKTIVANAESTVSGLRRPREQFNALFICAGLFLFALFALGADAGRIFSGFAAVFEQIVAVGGFFAHLVYSIFLGMSIVVRSLAAQFRFDVVIAVVFAAIGAALLMFVSRKALRLRRAQ
jgi:anti-sigma factor RsiW